MTAPGLTEEPPVRHALLGVLLVVVTVLAYRQAVGLSVAAYETVRRPCILCFSNYLFLLALS